MARDLLIFSAELGNESENYRKRNVIKFGKSPRGFVGIREIVCGLQIRWLTCLINYLVFFHLSS
jgi:hypothetical protein